MLGDYKVGRCSRQCYSEKRPLREGEWYYSVVITDGDECERRDYSADAWDGPPEGAVGHWKCRMPLSGDKKMVLAPRAVLIDLLRQMEDMPDQAKTRYLLALILLRRRFLRPASALPPHPNSSGNSTATGQDEEGEIPMMHLEVVEDGSTVDIVQCVISKQESESLSESLTELLYCEASEIEQE